MDDFLSGKIMNPLLACSSSSSSSSGKRMKPLVACSSHHHRNWSGLLSEILVSIMHRLPSTDDFVRFGAVCRPWRSVFLQRVSSGKAPLVPFLLIVPQPPEDRQERLLYSPSTKRVYDFRLRVPHNKVCRGSSFGWLVTIERLVEHTNFRMQLHNPFLDRIIDLPPPDDVLGPQPADEGDLNSNYPWDGHDLYKAVLSSDPSSSPNDFVVMAIMSRYQGLAYFKPGNTTWTSISIGGSWYTDQVHHCRSFIDIIFFRKTNQFCTLLDNATVLAIDLLGGEEAGNPKFTQVAPRPPTPSHTFPSFPSYLAEDLSTGDLFLIYKQTRHTTEEDPESFKKRIVRNRLTGEGRSGPSLIMTFVVFKLDTTCGMWTLIDDLGENIMFLGSNGSILRSASDCPGCEPNCIYYTDEKFHGRFWGYGPPFNGVYNLNDGSTHQHYSPTTFTPVRRKPLFNPSTERSTVVLPEAIWLEPTLKI